MVGGGAKSPKKKPRLPLRRRIQKAQDLIRAACLESSVKVVSMGGESPYFVDNFKFLQRTRPDAKFVILMGSDLVLEFHKWRSWKKITLLAPFLIFLRPGFENIQETPLIKELKGKYDPRKILDAEPSTWSFSTGPVSCSSSSEIVVQSVMNKIREILELHQGENIKVLDLGASSLWDKMVIVNCKNRRHIRTIADKIREHLKKETNFVPIMDGKSEDNESWVVLDADSILIHFFSPEARSFYDLENIWSSDRVSKCP